MSLDAVLRERFAAWRDELFDWGFVLEEPPRPAIAGNQIVVFARWPLEYRPPQLTITIQELWVPGGDPNDLDGTSLKHCHLEEASWHAQFNETQWTGSDRQAERLDLDRAKPRSLMIHRHPLGRVNGVRRPEARMLDPAAWLQRVGNLLAEL